MDHNYDARFQIFGYNSDIQLWLYIKNAILNAKNMHLIFGNQGIIWELILENFRKAQIV